MALSMLKLLVLSNLANAYGGLGDRQEQKRLLLRALVIGEHYYGPEHIEVARTLSNLARCLWCFR
jgi:hypothetical protein